MELETSYMTYQTACISAQKEVRTSEAIHISEVALAHGVAHGPGVASLSAAACKPWHLQMTIHDSTN